MEYINHLNICKLDPLHDPKVYRRLIGRLLYLGFTRPDISFVVNKLSQYMSRPCSHQLTAAHRVLRYLKGTAGLGLLYSIDSDLAPSIFSYTDWDTCLDSRRSVTGYCLFLGNSMISWRSKKQSTVSRSSAEAEYRAMTQATCEVVWIDNLLKEFGISRKQVVPLFCDNKAAIHITSNPVFHERTEHIKIDCHTIKD